MEEEQEQEEAPPPEEPFYEPAKGSVGRELELVFDDLYPDNSVNLARTQLAGVAAVEPPPLTAEAKRALQDVDVQPENEAQKKGREQLAAETARIENVQTYLAEQKAAARAADLEIEDYLLSQGLTVKHQYPVGETLYELDAEKVQRDKLLDPHEAVIPVETEQAIAIGAKKKHPNYLVKAKPEAPTYYKSTASLAIRKEVRGITKVYTEEQRKELQQRHTTRPKRPRPKVLPAHERETNAQILRRMTIPTDFLRNPRYVPRDEGKCPFRITPASVIFEGYELGSVYEMKIEFLNCEGLGRRLRLVPFQTSVFSVSTGLEYQNKNVGQDASIAPGMKAYLSIWFSPQDLNDVSDVLYIQTEQGKFSIPLAARRFQPELVLEENPIRLGYVLAGGFLQKTITVKNVGGEGAFRFIAGETGDEGEAGEQAVEQLPPTTAPTSQGSALTGGTGARDMAVASRNIVGPYYDVSDPENTTFVHGAFRITPASFYLEHNQTCSVTFFFRDNPAVAIGVTNLPFVLEANNFTSIAGSIEVLVDTLRLEMTAFAKELAPSLSRELKGGASVGGEDKTTKLAIADEGVLRRVPAPGVGEGEDLWALAPWQLRFQIQLPAEESLPKFLTLSNGSHLPLTVEWVFVAPPPAVAQQIANGALASLDQDLLDDMVTWQEIAVECAPFRITDRRRTIGAFSDAKFEFVYTPLQTQTESQREVSHNCFAYLCVVESRCDKACSSAAEQLRMQGSLQPEGYVCGMPLAANKWHLRLADKDTGAPGAEPDPRAVTVSKENYDLVSPQEPVRSSVCLMYGINLMGQQCAPQVTLAPNVVGFANDPAPYLTHQAKLVLTNAGSQSMKFRVRTTARKKEQTLASSSAVSDYYDVLWVVGSEECGADSAPSPQELERPHLEGCEDQWERLERFSSWYTQQWPPLPPALRAREYGSKPVDDGYKVPLHHSNVGGSAEHLVSSPAGGRGPRGLNVVEGGASSSSDKRAAELAASRGPPGGGGAAGSGSAAGGTSAATAAAEGHKVVTVGGGDVVTIKSPTHHPPGLVTTLEGSAFFESTARSEARDLIRYPDDPIRRSPRNELDELGKSLTQFEKEEDLRKTGQLESYLQETHKSLKDLLTQEERDEILFSSQDAALETRRGFQLQKEKELLPFRGKTLFEVTANSSLMRSLGPDEPPGFGALAVLGVAPDVGQIAPAGGKVTLNLFFRAAVECDLDAVVEIEIGEAVFPFRVLAPVRAPKPVFRSCAVLDFGIVHAREQHNLKMEVANPTDLPTVIKLCVKDKRSEEFTKESRERKNFMAQRGAELSLEEFEAGKEEFHKVWSTFADVVETFMAQVADKSLYAKGGQEEWEEAMTSGGNALAAKAAGGGGGGAGGKINPGAKVGFFPEFLVLPPRAKRDVFVTLRARNEENINDLAKVLAYGAPTTGNQWMQVLASVQRPKVVPNKSHFHFAITYTGEISDEKFTLKLKNQSGLPAPLRWRLPGSGDPLQVSLSLKDNARLDHISPEGEIAMDVRVTPTVKLAARDSTDARVDVLVHVAGQPLPVRITITSVVFGLEVDYLVQSPLEEAWPDIPYLRLPRAMLTEKQARLTSCHPVYKDFDPPALLGPRGRSGTGTLTRTQSRTAGTTTLSRSGDEKSASGFTSAASSSRRTASSSYRSGSHRTRSGAASGVTADTKALDFGEMPLLGKQHLRLLLYNRTGIAADWTAHMGKYKAYVPKKGSKHAALLEKVNSPKGGAGKTKGSEFVLDDKHETQVFSSAMGQQYAEAKMNKEAGSLNLKYGLGFAVALEPASGRLEPFGMQVIDCYCYSDLPGTMVDHVHLNIGDLPEFLVDARVTSVGNPLYLAPLQIGLDLNEQNAGRYPELSYGTLVLADRVTKRRLRLGNLSSANIDVEWRFVKQSAVESTMLASTQDETMQPSSRIFSECLLQDVEAAGGKEDCSWSLTGLDPEKVAGPPLGDAAQVVEHHQHQATNLTPTEPFVIAPEKGRVGKHAEADFDTTLRTDSVGRYHYKLLGIGRYAPREPGEGFTDEEPPSLAVGGGEQVAGGATSSSSRSRHDAGAKAGVKTSSTSKPGSKMAAALVERTLVETLPELALDGLADSDSDADPVEFTPLEDESATHLLPAKDHSLAAAHSKRRKRARIHAAPQLDGVLTSSGTTSTTARRTRTSRPIPMDNVVSTVIVECLGECVVPQLHLDRKTSPSYGEPIVKFFCQTLNPIPNLWTKNRVGAICVGGGNLDPAPGIALGLIRKVSFTQDLPCFVHCRFRIPHGRFRILKLEQAGKQPLLGSFLEKQMAVGGKNATQTPAGKQETTEPPFAPEPDADRFRICLRHKEVVSLLVEFVPPKQWEKPTQKFEGNLWIEYPCVEGGEKAAAFHAAQVVRLEGTAKKPELILDVVPIVEKEAPMPIPSYYPPWGEQPLPVVEFSYLHVEANKPTKRQLILSNKSNVVAKWKLFHVKAPARSKEQFTVREREEQSLDDPTAFKFDLVEGTIAGPSQRSRLLPVGPALPQAWGHEDAELYEPLEVVITFAPKVNRLYRCEFRLQVEGGNPVSFICTGTGSYDEEDDAMELIES